MASPNYHAVHLPTLPSRHAPEVTAHCEGCGRETGTVYLLLRSGMVGNCCIECRRCRRGRPYVPRRYLIDDHNPNVLRSAATGPHEYANHHA